MADNTFHMEVRVYNVDTPERMAAVKRAFRASARGMHAKLMLICGDTPEPEISLFVENIRNGQSEITLADEENENA